MCVATVIAVIIKVAHCEIAQSMQRFWMSHLLYCSLFSLQVPKVNRASSHPKFAGAPFGTKLRHRLIHAAAEVSRIILDFVNFY